MTSHKLSSVVMYELSAPSDLCGHPIANTPVKMGTAMNNDLLMIDDDNASPMPTFTPTKQAKPHPESNPDSKEMPTTAAAMTAAMTANEMPTAATVMMAGMTIMMKPPAVGFFGHCVHHHAYCKAKTAQHATQHQADTDMKPCYSCEMNFDVCHPN